MERREGDVPSEAEQQTLHDLALQRGRQITNYDELLADKPEAEPVNIGFYMANSQEADDELQLTAKVWVPGLKNPATGKLGLVCTVGKPSPDQEIAIYAKAREKELPEDAKKYFDVGHLNAKGRTYRFECIWKLCYCCVAPVVTFDWAAKIMSLPYGSQVVRPLIDRIDELMAITQPVDDLTDHNLFAYPTLFGHAKIAARDGKLAEYFGSADRGVVQAICDNARTMWLIQMAVIREDAELMAVITETVKAQLKKGDYDPSAGVRDALRDPVAQRAALAIARSVNTGAPLPDDLGR